MPLIEFELLPQYRDWWGEDKAIESSEGMETYLRRALVAQFKAYPTAEERAVEVTKRFPEPEIPPAVVVDETNAETILKLHVIRKESGQAFFPEKPVMEFRLKRSVQNVPTYVLVDSAGHIELSQMADLGFFKAFWRALKEQMTDPHTQLFLQFMIGDWVRTGGLKKDMGNPLAGITKWFNKIRPNWADDIEGFTNTLKGVWDRLTPRWLDGMDRVSVQVVRVWDFLTPDWMNSVNGIKLEFDKFKTRFKAGITEVIEDARKTVYEDILPTTASIKKGLDRWKTSGEKFIDLEMDVANVVKNPGNWLDENFTVPLRTMKGNLDEQLSRIANYLALFGVNEAGKARVYAKSLIDKLIQPADRVSMKIDRWEKQVEVTLQEFAQTEFREAQKKANRVTNIIDATMEMLKVEDPETARLRKEPWGRSIEAYPATTVSLLEAGVSHSLPMKVTYPAPVENTLPEIQNASYMIDRIMENLYLGTDGKPINEALGKDFVMTTDPAKIKGKVIKIEDVYEHPDLSTFDDLACNCAFGSAAQDEGTLLDTVWSIASDVPLGILSLIALRLCRLPYKYLLYPAVFEYTLQAVDWYVSEPEDYTDRLDEFNVDFWNSIIQWSERSDELEPWLPTP